MPGNVLFPSLLNILVLLPLLLALARSAARPSPILFLLLLLLFFSGESISCWGLIVATTGTLAFKGLQSGRQDLLDFLGVLQSIIWQNWSLDRH